MIYLEILIFSVVLPVTSDDGEHGNSESISLAFSKRGTGAEVLFPNNIIGDFVVYQCRIETHSWKLFVHQEKSEVFSIFSVNNF